MARLLVLLWRGFYSIPRRFRFCSLRYPSVFLLATHDRNQHLNLLQDKDSSLSLSCLLLESSV